MKKKTNKQPTAAQIDKMYDDVVKDIMKAKEQHDGIVVCIDKGNTSSLQAIRMSSVDLASSVLHIFQERPSAKALVRLYLMRDALNGDDE